MARELAIKLDQLPPVDDWVVEYDRRSDTLFMRVGKSRPATSVDLNGEVWVRVDPTTGNVVGFETERYREVFFVRHPEMPRPQTVKSAIQPAIEREGWLHAFFAFLRKLYGSDDPPQHPGRFLPAQRDVPLSP